MKVQGYNFIQDSLNPVMEDLYKALPLDPHPDGAETKEYLFVALTLWAAAVFSSATFSLTSWICLFPGKILYTMMMRQICWKRLITI